MGISKWKQVLLVTGGAICLLVVSGCNGQQKVKEAKEKLLSADLRTQLVQRDAEIRNLKALINKCEIERKAAVEKREATTKEFEDQVLTDFEEIQKLREENEKYKKLLEGTSAESQAQ